MLALHTILILLPAMTWAIDTPAPNLIDANKDGFITQPEIENYFLSYDGDKDGELTLAEFKAAVDNIDPAFAGRESFLFAIFDRDANGKVNKSEIDGAFKMADMNKDNQIDTSELHLFETLTQLSGILVG